MKKIIWIYGNQASGKSFLMNALSTPFYCQTIPVCYPEDKIREEVARCKEYGRSIIVFDEVHNFHQRNKVKRVAAEFKDIQFVVLSQQPPPKSFPCYVFQAQGENR